MSSHVDEALEKQKGRKTKAKVFLDHAESVLASLRELIKRPNKLADAIRQGGRDKTAVIEEARRLVEEMSQRGCVKAMTWGRIHVQRKMAKKLLDTITKMAAASLNSETLNQTADSSMVLLGHMSDLLLEANAASKRARHVNLKSVSSLEQLQHVLNQTIEETHSFHTLTESARHHLTKLAAMFLTLEDTKHGIEKDAARLHGAKQQLRKKIDNIFHVVAKMEIIGEAEEHARELSRLASGMQNLKKRHDRMLPTTNNTNQSSKPKLLNIITNMEDAAMAAHWSKMIADEGLQDVVSGGLLLTAESLRHNSTHLSTAAMHSQNDFRELSQSLNTHKDGVKRWKDKGESLRFDTSRVTNELKKLRRDDPNVLIESAKSASSATNDTVTHVTRRLGKMREEMNRLTLNNTALALNDSLNDAQHAVRTLHTAFPMIKDELSQVEALGKTSPASGNMTENIFRIKDLVQETRSYLNKISLAMHFDGKRHIELRPPSDGDDVKAFTAVDLLLSVEKKPVARQRKRRDKRRDYDMFVLYLGAQNSSGDYLGMAIRHGVLICFYKLGGHVHEVATSPITTFTSPHASSMDRVVFRRIYQDAEVNITANFTSEWPMPYAPRRHLPHTMARILDLKPQQTVFYVGGYPQHFNPPKELRYPGYRGYVKLSYINDEPFCLYNYKSAVNMKTSVHSLMLPPSKVFDYYQGSGYREALVKNPHKRTHIYKFHTNSRATDALLFCMGTKEAFWCLLVKQGHLVLQGQHMGIKQRIQSADKVSLFDKHFSIAVEDTITVHYEDKHISIEHSPIPYKRFYIGGVPQHISTRYNISAPPLRGCVDHVSADAQIVEYKKTMGVSDGCPFAMLGVRTVTLRSILFADWLSAPHLQHFGLGFRSTHKHGIILRSRSQRPSRSHISLSHGYLQLTIGQHNITSSQRYDDGKWHYLCVAQTPSLEVQVDNINVTFREPIQAELRHPEVFNGCITNIYSRSLQSFTPMDLNSLLPTGGVILSGCHLGSPTQAEHLPKDVSRPLQMLKLTADQTHGECGHRRAPRRGYELSQEDSWLAYKLPQQDLNYRPHFSLDVKTKSSNGVILFVEGSGVVPLLVLYMANGRIKMSLGSTRAINHRLKTNDGHWHRVECSVESNTFHLLVDGIRVTDGHLPNDEGSSLNFHGLVYLGGHTGNSKSITGCVRGFRMNNEPVGNPEGGHRVSPCSDGHTESGVYFTGGHVVLDDPFAVGDHFVLTFELRPRRLSGLLFHAQAQGTSFDVFLINNTVGVTVNDRGQSVSAVLTPQNLCDGEFHVIKVSKEQKYLTLMVDALSQRRARTVASIPSAMTRTLLYIGGATESSRAPVTSPYIGCLRDVNINGGNIAFETQAVTVIGAVDVNSCPVH
ncbi:laminin subunit alpha-3 [Corythoichthys intestinalis]|uniref:laminin subunit alpha-3 n=1 Tax=Corythoichthys intestinalis TaxID=161448 RepID=UPI0025A67656|nr:laminin subunit alpha-3 [Corythoichthys intestinalis]